MYCIVCTGSVVLYVVQHMWNRLLPRHIQNCMASASGQIWKNSILKTGADLINFVFKKNQNVSQCFKTFFGVFVEIICITNNNSFLCTDTKQVSKSKIYLPISS